MMKPPHASAKGFATIFSNTRGVNEISLPFPDILAITNKYTSAWWPSLWATPLIHRRKFETLFAGHGILNQVMKQICAGKREQMERETRWTSRNPFQVTHIPCLHFLPLVVHLDFFSFIHFSIPSLHHPTLLCRFSILHLIPSTPTIILLVFWLLLSTPRHIFPSSILPPPIWFHLCSINSLSGSTYRICLYISPSSLHVPITLYFTWLHRIPILSILRLVIFLLHSKSWWRVSTRGIDPPFTSTDVPLLLNFPSSLVFFLNSFIDD